MADKNSEYYGKLLVNLNNAIEQNPEDEALKKVAQETYSLYQLKLAEEDIPETTAGGVGAGIVRGVAPLAVGAAAGAAMGAPIAGVGAVPGAAIGAGSMMLTQLIGDPIMTGINSMLGTNYKTPSEAMQGYLTSLGVEQPDTAAERILQTMTQGAAESITGVGAARQVAKAAETQATRETAESLAQAPVEQVVGGTAAAGGGQTAGELGGGALTQFGTALTTGTAAGKVAGVRAQTDPSSIPQDIREAEGLGIPVTTTDVVRPSSFVGKWLQSMGEKIPVIGTSGLRADQQEARVAAVNNLLREYGADEAVELSGQMVDDLLKTRGEALRKYTDMKTEVIEGVSGRGPVNVGNTTNAIDIEIARLQALKSDQYKPVIDILTDWKQAIQDQDIQQIEELRKQIGLAFESPDMASIKSTGQKSLNRIYGPLKEDMRGHILENGGQRSVDKWEIANRRLKEEADELNSRGFKALLSRGEATPEMVDRFLFSKKPSEIRQLYRNLGPSGIASAQIAILRKAASKALGIERVEMTDLQTLSPEKFLSEMRRLGPSVDIFFKGKIRDDVDALTRALDLTKRASQATAVVKTGEQVAIPVLSSWLGSMFGAMGGVAAVGATGGALRIYETKAVRDALLKLNQTVKNSEQEMEAAKRLVEAIRAAKSSEEQE